MDTSSRIIDITDRLAERNMSERRRSRVRRTLGSIAAVATATTVAVLAWTHSGNSDKPATPNFTCATTVDPGEGLWSIAEQIAGSDPAKIATTRHEVAFNNGYLDSDRPGIGAVLGLTPDECEKMEVSHPDQVTGYAE
ncbi:hypothetical protein KA093_01920 [Candidatus Saccharibacteria bacterium]|nr:hypothetical protein [Candidatus Saccharibacteria bacterium]